MMKIFKWDLPLDCYVEFHVADDHKTTVIMFEPEKDSVTAEFDTYSEAVVSLCRQLLVAYNIITKHKEDAIVHVCGGDIH
jgi:hypothetical protein